jgi:tetratricopeptide (TPR) repeat protein
VAWCTHWLGRAGMYTGADLPLARRQLREAMDRFEKLGDEWAYAWSLRYVGSLDEDPEREISLQRDALRRFRALGDMWSAAFSLFGLGIALLQREPADAVPSLEEGRRLASALGDRVMVAHNERAMGLAALLQEQDQEAESLLDGARRILGQVGDENCVAMCSAYLSVIRLRQGRADEAVTELTEALAGFRSIGRSSGMASALHWLGLAALANGDPERAAELMGAAATARAESHFPLGDDVLRGELERGDRAVRRKLGRAAYEAHRREGEKRSLEESVSLVLD